MKKILGLSLLIAVFMTACGRNEPQTTTGNFDYKTGLGIHTHTNGTYGYSEGKNGQSAVSTTIVAAVFDKDGKIIDIKIDEVESKTGFDNTGRLTNYTDRAVVSKKELGNDYGMKAASSIGKEWYEQIETLEKWLVGKDVNTVISSARGRLGQMTGDNNMYGNGSAGMWGGNDANMWGGTATSSPNTWMGDNVTGRLGGSDTGMAISASPSPGTGDTGTLYGDTDGMAEDFANGVGDVIDDITDGGSMGDNTGNATASPSPDTGWMDSDLKAGVTIDTTYIQMAIEKAYRNAK